MVKKLLKKICSGVGMGCFVFVAVLFIAPVFAGGANAFFATRTGEEWQLSALCFIVISLGFNVPSLVYENERLAYTHGHRHGGLSAYGVFCRLDGF